MPDINASRSLFYLSQVRATAGLIDAVAHWDECVLLLCLPGVSTAMLLDPAEAELSSHRLRCIRVYGCASGRLALRNLIAQIVGRADPDALTDHDLRAGFVTLTEPGADYDRVVLLVTEAHTLQPSALDYIQLACQSSLRLRVVLAGEPILAATLATDRFAHLRQRMSRTLDLPGPMPDELLDLISEAPVQFPAPTVRKTNRARPLVRLGVAASLVLLIGAVGWRYMSAPLAAIPPADAPALSQQAVAPISAEPAAAPRQRAGAAEQRESEVSPPGLKQDAVALPQPAARASASIVLPEALQARGDRGTAGVVTALAGHLTGERRCRGIVLQAQLGKDLSDAETQFLRDDCRAK